MVAEHAIDPTVPIIFYVPTSRAAEIQQTLSPLVQDLLLSSPDRRRTAAARFPPSTVQTAASASSP